MSEHITHIAVFEDTVQILKKLKNFDPFLLSCLVDEYDTGMLASGSRKNHIYAVPALERLRGKSQYSDSEKREIAASFGWFTHRAADLATKPLNKIVDKENIPGFSGSENKMYHDVFSLKEIYQKSRKSTLSPYEWITESTFSKDLKNHSVSDEIDLVKTEKSFSFLWQNQILLLQSGLSNDLPFIEFIDTVLESQQDFHEYFDEYCDAWENPDPAKWKRYILDQNFYNENDALISWLRNNTLQWSDDFLAPAKNTSVYGQILIACINSSQSASEYWNFRIEKVDLYDVVRMYGNERI